MTDVAAKRQSEYEKFVIDCRTVRLWIAKNPGSTASEIKKGTGLNRIDQALLKMIGMELITVKYNKNKEGINRREWFVVPK